MYVFGNVFNKYQKYSFLELNLANFILIIQWKWALQSLLSHFSRTDGEYAPLLSVISRLLFSLKRTDAHWSYGIFKRGTAPLYTDAHAQLDMHPSHFSIICPPPLSTRGTNRVLSFVRLYIKRDKAIFSALGPCTSPAWPLWEEMAEKTLIKKTAVF